MDGARKSTAKEKMLYAILERKPRMKSTSFCTRLLLLTVLAAGSTVLLASQTAGDYPALHQRWTQQIKQALYVPDKLPPLETRLWSSFSPAPGVIADRVTYRTASGMLVPAIVYRPEHWAGERRGVRLPGIVR